jgi:hypothetical protein
MNSVKFKQPVYTMPIPKDYLKNIAYDSLETCKKTINFTRFVFLKSGIASITAALLEVMAYSLVAIFRRFRRT